MSALQSAVFWLILLFSFCDAAPLLNEATDLKLDPNSRLIEGDILLTPEQYETFFGKTKKATSSRHKRQLFRGVGMWPDNTVPYSFDNSVPTEKRVLARKAMDEMTASTCLTYIEDDTATDRIEFTMSSICASYIGRVGNAQKMFIGGCWVVPDIVHELFHALGVMHTHSRSDRDIYLKVNTSLFSEGDEVNYEIYPSQFTYNVIPFEYGSLMLYYARDVCWPRDESFVSTMGTNFGGFYDFKAIHELYQCSCPTEIECLHGGYMNTQTCDRCVCPPGYGGKQCETAPEEFSRKLTATLEWQTHSIRFGFDGFSEKVYKRATMFIEAPADKRIQVEVTQMEGFSCYTPCLWNGFEVKEVGDPRRTNRFLCCNSGDGWNYNYTSKLNPTPVILYSLEKRLTFGMRYRYIDASISALPTTNNTYDDFRYPA